MASQVASQIILCIDDDTTVLNALRTLLEGDGYVVEIAESGLEALEICSELQKAGHEICVVFSDFIMPGMRGDEVLVRLHNQSPQTIKIMLTGQSDLDGIKRAINEADLYRFLEKPFNNADLQLTAKSALRAFSLDRLLQGRNEELERINNKLEQLVEARTRELLEKNKQLELLSTTDPLTKLYNRLMLDRVLTGELNRSLRYSGSFALVLLDIDQFKLVNDNFGHPVGDQFLIELGSLLKNVTRKVDIVGRWGGEEFLVICPNTEINGAVILAEKLRQEIAEHVFPMVGHKTASFGVTAVKADDTIPLMIDRADVALYRSKAKGRNRVEFNA